MNQHRLKLLLELYTDNQSTKEELVELFSLLKNKESAQQLKEMIVDAVNDVENENILSQKKWNEVWNNIKKVATGVSPKKKPVLLINRYAVAASLALLIGTVIFFITHKKRESTTEIVKSGAHTNDIGPGGNKAVLTLADGSTIILDTAKNGYLTNQNNTKIIKLTTGILSYKEAATNAGKVLFNTISTPRGGQYQVELPDGTAVWLNAESSLKFPTIFIGKERRVELKGEAYFEVAKNASMPFHVSVNNTDITVLGTHFNIMSYGEEENISTTLLEGSINLTANGITKNLEPGKQADVNKNTKNIEIHSTNIKQAVAWKNGEFRFKETDIKTLMRQVARWYDVEVEYQTSSTNQYFTASLPRMQNVSALLQLLELTGTVHFKIEHKKIIVLP